MPDLSAIMIETKKTHTMMVTANEELKVVAQRITDLEAKSTNIPADLQETIAQISADVTKFDAGHTTLIGEYKTQQDAIEAKLNEMEALGGAGSNKDKKNKLAEDHSIEFKKYLCHGMNSADHSDAATYTALTDLQKKSMYAGSDPDGGWAIPRNMSAMIQTAKRDATPFRQEASATTVEGDTFRYLIDINETQSGWVSERGLRPSTNTPTMREASILVHEMYAAPGLTQNVLDDSSFNLEAWLAEKIATSFSNLEAYSFLLGTGNGRPRGLLTYEAGTEWNTIEQITSGAVDAITPIQLMELQDALKDKFANNAKFYMNRRTVTKIRALQTTDNQFLWQPGLVAGAPSTLLGDPIVKMGYMPTVSAGALAIGYGDLKQAYQIVDRYANRVLRDATTQHPYVVFKTNTRVGGDVVNFEAMKLMAIGA